MKVKEALSLIDKSIEGRSKTGAVGGARAKTQSASGAEAQAAAEDRVEISGRSREMAKAAEAATSAPDLRKQKIMEIKKRIENQEYQVDPMKVAHKMITNFLSENF
ncbi:MAG: flagellar biosynthesis anti-sigma factor FlgM [Deltaproteobacteria bacterium]|nr:flagellar biosynthesis anti-sigma factor FlgM [Deltaproteobacteria bacterium]